MDLRIGDAVAVEDENGETRCGIYLGQDGGYSQIAFPTANVPNDAVKGVVGRTVPA